MSTVTLSSVWLNDAKDPSDYVEISYLGDAYQVTETLGGGVEHDYASGRSRAWSTAQDITAASLGLEKATPAVLAWLKAHRGRVVCVRDWTGRKFHAVFHVVGAEVSTGPVGWASTVDKGQVELTSCTFSEAV